MTLAIIGGTGIDEMTGFKSGRTKQIDTKYGTAVIVECELAGQPVIFVPRHGTEHNLLPSQINYRSQIAALKKMEVDRVIGISAVGSLKPELPAGSFAVMNDFIDMTRCRQSTFFDQPDSPVVHTDFTCPYCPEISTALRQGCENQSVIFEPRATYLAAEGPRYETPAEVWLFSSWGAHVVGMTNVPEVVLAREAGLCYGTVAIVSNLACGLSDKPLSHDEVRAAVTSAGVHLGAILADTIKALPGSAQCACASIGYEIL